MQNITQMLKTKVIETRKNNSFFTLHIYTMMFTLLFSHLTFAQTSQTEMLPSEVLQVSDDSALNTTVLIADKESRKLYYYPKQSQLNQPQILEIDIGKNGGDKKKRDDQRTPEGIFLLEKKLTQPEIPFEKYGSMAFTTDYPNYFDRREGKTGDGIWLHSVPDTVPLNRGSRGCVVVRNQYLKELENNIELNKSYLIISPRVTFVSEQEHKIEKDKINNWLESWRSKWEQQDIDTYMSNYSDDFSAPGFNKSSWQKHKLKLKQIYKNIKIELSKATILKSKNQYIIKFIQNYESDSFKDAGIKTLYILEQNNQLKIVREEWDKI